MTIVILMIVLFGLVVIGTLVSKKTCPKCRQSIDAKATVCPKCQSDISPSEAEEAYLKKRNANIAGGGLVVMLLAVGFIVFGGDDSKDTESPTSSLLRHEVYRKWEVGSNGIGLEIIVDQSEKRADVEQFARGLMKMHKSKDFVVLAIFDSRDAAIDHQHCIEAGYKLRLPEDEYWKHFLIDAVRNDATGHNNVTWVAKGRNH